MNLLCLLTLKFKLWFRYSTALFNGDINLWSQKTSPPPQVAVPPPREGSKKCSQAVFQKTSGHRKSSWERGHRVPRIRKKARGSDYFLWRDHFEVCSPRSCFSGEDRAYEKKVPEESSSRKKKIKLIPFLFHFFLSFVL